MSTKTPCTTPHASYEPRLEEIEGWVQQLEALHVRIAPRFEQALLIHRPLDAPDDPKQLAYYLAFAPVGTHFETLVAVVGRRWTVEESLEEAKGEVEVDYYGVRHYHEWYRQLTLAMLALAYLAVVRSHLPGSALKGGRLWRSWSPTTAKSRSPCLRSVGSSTAWSCASSPHRRRRSSGRAGVASTGPAPCAATTGANVLGGARSRGGWSR